MPQSARHPFFRSVGELITIVAGILLALWADAAWEARQEAIEERQYLAALAEDFTRLSEDAYARLDRYSAWKHDLTALMSADPATTPPDSIDAWLAGGFFDIDQFEPPLPTLDDLVATGRLGVLSSDDLRIQLATVVRMLAELEELEAELSTIQFQRIDPLLIEYGDIGRLGRTMGNVSTRPQPDWTAARLLSAPGYLNLLNMKLLGVGYLNAELSAVASTGEVILLTIEEQFGR